ncbi:hypothetical protein D9M71_262490 [compost metagenome]
MAVQREQVGAEDRQRLTRFDPGQLAALQEGDQLVGIRRLVVDRGWRHQRGRQLFQQAPGQFVVVQFIRGEGAQVDFHAVEADQLAGAVDAVEGGLQRRQDHRIETVAQQRIEAAEDGPVRRGEVEDQPADAMFRGGHAASPAVSAG